MSEEVLAAIGIFLLVFAAVFGFWFVTGGPQRSSSYEGVFIKPLEPDTNATIYGPNKLPKGTLATTTINVPKVTISFSGISTTTPKSVYAGYIVFDGLAGVKSSDPDIEYVRLFGENGIETPIDIAGWNLSDGENYYPIGTSGTPIYVSAGTRVIVTTGTSSPEFLAQFGPPYPNEIRIFLGLNQEIWPNLLGEIYLVDNKGDIVDKLSY